jgi:hypothetical protein
MKRSQTVWVRNNGTETFHDRYDGEDFDIEPGGVCEMLLECAELCLGFGQDDKTRCLRRLGWAFTQNRMPEALARLESFSFHMTEKEALEHDPNKAAKPQVHSSAPVVGGEPAAEVSAPAVASPHKEGERKNPLKKLADAAAATAAPG